MNGYNFFTRTSQICCSRPNKLVRPGLCSIYKNDFTAWKFTQANELVHSFFLKTKRAIIALETDNYRYFMTNQYFGKNLVLTVAVSFRFLLQLYYQSHAELVHLFSSDDSSTRDNPGSTSRSIYDSTIALGSLRKAKSSRFNVNAAALSESAFCLAESVNRIFGIDSSA